MKSIFRLSVRNPVLVHMITIAVIVFGTYAFINMPREVDPDMSFNWAIIWVRYPGVSPEEIEKLIIKPIEDEIADVDQIESITSISAEGYGELSIKFDQDISKEEFEKLYQDLRGELDKVNDLPEDADDVVLFKLDSNSYMEVINVVLAGNISEKEMYKLAEELQDDIEAIDGVSRANMYGMRDREIWVEVQPDHLDRHTLALSQVVSALASKNMNVPAGSLKIGRSEYLLRTIGEFDSIDQIGRVIVRHIPGGGKIHVGDVAQIRDTYAEPTLISRLDGKPSLTLGVSKRSGGSTIEIVNGIKELVEEYRRQRLPETVKIALVSDSSIFIHSFLSKLQNNAAIGVLLVIGVLYLFMGLRNAIFVALGIPITFMAIFAAMKIKGESINPNSLFALVLVLGIIVDDAIVVMENIYRRMQRGEPPSIAAVNGTHEVAMPVIAASLTTIAAFLPLALLPGIIGKFMKVIPIVVALALAASLFECFFILPSHIADWGRVGGSSSRNLLMQRLRAPYTRLLASALRRRYWVLGGVTACLLMSFSLVPLIGVDMFAGDDIPMILAYVNMPPGTRIEATDEVMKQFEEAASTLPKFEVKAVITRTGIRSSESGSTRDTHLGTLTVDLVEAKYRERSVDEIIADLRQKCSVIAGPENVQFSKVETGPPAGAAVEAMVKGKYFDELEAIAAEIKAELAQTPGVTDIDDNHSPGKEEFQLTINEAKANEYGLTVQQIALSVRGAFDGAKATVFRDGDEEIDVVVKFKDASEMNVADVMGMKLVGLSNNSQGIASPVVVPLRDVAKVSVKRGYAAIRRFNQERAITVTANVDSEVISAVKVNQMIEAHFERIKLRYPGYTLEFGGQFAEFQTAFSGMLQLFGVGILLIYFILGAQFKSFIQPLVIMATVPFAFIGAMLGLITSGYPLSIASMYGIIALAGIVVNDSIVLVEFINRQRTAGVRKWRAIINAGRTRLRPIILTSVTTVCGLLPMALGIGGKSATWMPMANTVVWGLIVATVLTLFVIPAFYAIVDDFSTWRGVRVEEKGVEILEEKQIGAIQWATGDDD